MIFVRRVNGESMPPTLLQGQVVVCMTRGTYRVGDIIVALVDGREVVKRIIRDHGDTVWLAGDNARHSTDSRHYGAVDKSAILGGMKYALPVSQTAPKLRNVHGTALGWVAAAIMIVFAVIHLFRIDTFVPELSRALGGDRTLTLWLGSGIIVAEVFALPFLMRMRLSTLAQYSSGALSVIVPLFWCLIAVWSYGSDVSTAQLGEFKALPSSGLLIAGNVAWLCFAYFTLWALGYDHRPHEKQSIVTKLFARLSKTK